MNRHSFRNVFYYKKIFHKDRNYILASIPTSDKVKLQKKDHYTKISKTVKFKLCKDQNIRIFCVNTMVIT